MTTKSTTLNVAVVFDHAFLVVYGRTRNRTWQWVQRALRRAPMWGITADDKLVSIARNDLGCTYAAPGVFTIETQSGRTYDVVITEG